MNWTAIIAGILIIGIGCLEAFAPSVMGKWERLIRRRQVAPVMPGDRVIIGVSAIVFGLVFVIFCGCLSPP